MCIFGALAVHSKRVMGLFGKGKGLRRLASSANEPVEVGPHQHIAKVVDVRDKGIVAVEVASQLEGPALPSLAFLPSRMRGVNFLRRGTVVIIDPRHLPHYMCLGAFVVVSHNTGCDERDKVAWAIDATLQATDMKRLQKASEWYAFSFLVGHVC